LKIPVPPKREQREIADAYAEIKRAELAAIGHISRINGLQASIVNVFTS
jgi:hypothetical protein